jgi:hypothetical protein
MDLLTITKEDMEFAGIMALLVLAVLAPITGFISTLLIGYFDPRYKANRAWMQKRNWRIIAPCVLLALSVATYGFYLPYISRSNIGQLTFGHLFFSLCYLAIVKELFGLMSGHNIDKRVMFTLFVNLICFTLTMIFIR